MSVKTRTRIEIVVQSSDEDAVTFRKALQKMIDEVEKNNPYANPMCLPSASSTGRMTVILHWKEIVKRKRTAKTKTK